MIQLLQGDAIEVLATLAPGSIQTVITSPPYYGLRRYTNDPREIGQEAAPDCLAWARREPPCGACYVCALRAVFAQVWRVLRDDGTCWINLGDSHGSGDWGANRGERANRRIVPGERVNLNTGIAAKNILLIPARVALALQSDGWIVRSDAIWSKPNCMPESVRDRPTRAHEYVYLLSKQSRYFYDSAAIAEPATMKPQRRLAPQASRANGHAVDAWKEPRILRDEPAPDGDGTRNKRSVWTIATRPYAGAHFATMPEALIEPCLLAGSSAQACETCGAAWGRVVEREKTDEQAQTRAKHLQSKKSTLSHSLTGHGGWAEHGSKVYDLGFAPRCACRVPCSCLCDGLPFLDCPICHGSGERLNTGAACSTVLDCFAGTGTVLRVAERYGRNAIGIELNPDYGELSDARTNGVQKELFV